jgi:hypothetical protein
VKQVKTETNLSTLDGLSQMDPVIMIDNNGMANVCILSGASTAGGRSGNDLVRVQQNLGFAAGFPSVSTKNWEAANPYNQQYRNVLNDLNSATTIPAGSLASGGANQWYPNVEFHKDTYHRGGTLYADAITALAFGGTPSFSGAPSFAAGAGFTGAGSQLDLGAISGAGTKTTGSTGDKILLYSASSLFYGIGVETNRMTLFHGTGGAVAVRTQSGSGDRGSAVDGVVLFGAGRIVIGSSAGSAPVPTAGANAGTSPPAPVLGTNSRDARGSATFGTGTTPAVGAQLVVTFGATWGPRRSCRSARRPARRPPYPLTCRRSAPPPSPCRLTRRLPRARPTPCMGLPGR